MEIIKLDSIKKSFEKRDILKNITLSINKKEIIGIYGKSGAGKTTLLRIISLLENYDFGDIYFYNENISYIKKNKNLRQKISKVFQKPILLNETVLYNIIYGLKVRNIKIETQIKDANYYLKHFSLINKKDEHSNKLSGGEVQRVALIQSIITKPEILILDEPTANLDDFNITKLNKLILELRDKYNSTTIICSHDITYLERICSKIYELKNGSLLKKVKKGAI